MPVLHRVAPRVPIADVLFVPQRPVMDAVFEVVDGPADVLVKSVGLLGRNGRPIDRVEAAVVIVKGPWLGNADVRQLAAASGGTHPALEGVDVGLGEGRGGG